MAYPRLYLLSCWKVEVVPTDLRIGLAELFVCGLGEMYLLYSPSLFGFNSCESGGRLLVMVSMLYQG